MKKIIIFSFGIFLLIISCSNNKKNTNNSSQTTLKTDSLKQVFCPIIGGVWVISDYIEEIKKTKSPQKSSNHLGFISAMVIYEKSDSVIIGVSLNNHEGFNFTAYFEQTQNKNSLKTNIPDYYNELNYYELGYEKINDEIFLFLYHYDQTNKLLNKTKYTKIAKNQSDSDMAFGIQLIVNELLFSGNYLIIDTTNTEQKVVFQTDGSVNGLSNFKDFYILTDFATSPEICPDIVIFDLHKPTQKDFAFQLKKDAIYLYSIIEKDDNMELDTLIYTLVKQ